MLEGLPGRYITMINPTKVKSLDGYKIWIEFEDGVSGDVDLSHFAGKGIFRKWDDHGLFDDVKIVFPYRAIQWGGTDELELCTDTFYLQLTGKTYEELISAVDEAAPIA